MTGFLLWLALLMLWGRGYEVFFSISSVFFVFFSLSAQEVILEVFTEDAYPLQYESEGKVVGSATTLVEKSIKRSRC